MFTPYSSWNIVDPNSDYFIKFLGFDGLNFLFVIELRGNNLGLISYQ